METQSRVCFHCVGREHPWNHMYVLRIQTRGNDNTLHALLLSTVLSSREDSAVTLTVSLSLLTSSLLLCLRTAVRSSLHHGIPHSWRQLVSFYNSPPFPSPILSVCRCNDCRAKPAASRLTGKSQAELAALLVNNKWQLRQSASAGMYRRLYPPPLLHSDLTPTINENESPSDCAVEDWWQIGHERTCESPAVP